MGKLVQRAVEILETFANVRSEKKRLDGPTPQLLEQGFLLCQRVTHHWRHQVVPNFETEPVLSLQ